MSKVSLPQGMRDFDAETVQKRNYILTTIRKVFELNGYQPLETPAMENLDTLMGKYGDEGDKLIFKILNNGLNDPKNIEKANTGFAAMMEGKNNASLTERALKYDLTIPFARHVAMNRGTINFPFKRYQVQPVWRADRPQKGRYREFTQCDADVVGSKSLWNEAELAGIYHNVFSGLGLNGYVLSINNRKILSALAEACGGANFFIPITIAIDKLDKIGIEKVQEALVAAGLSADQTDFVTKYLQISGNNAEKMQLVQELLKDFPEAIKGLEELKFVLHNSHEANIEVDFTLARGLNYYTGIIFEAKAPAGVKMGSIGGGGRYDDLTGLFGVPDVPGVGISFGVDRIYDVLEELQLFPASIEQNIKALIFYMGEASAEYCFKLVQKLRANNISCEFYPEQVKMDKQFKYADKKNIPFAVIIGEKEMETNTLNIKKLSTGEQQTIETKDLVDFLDKN